MTARKFLSGLIYTLSAAIGVLAFISPFFPAARSAALGATQGQGTGAMTMVTTTALVLLALTALLVEMHGQAMAAKTVATLGVLTAVASVLRFIEVAVPMPGGFSPIFAPIILVGYVFGSRFGFLMGTFTLLVSALITGGVGPWLPYQMFTTGWVGMMAGWLGRLMGSQRRPSGRRLGGEIVVLSSFGALWGILYGVIINLYFWPFTAGPTIPGGPDVEWSQIASQYVAFYLSTSLVWDLMRALGNAALIAALGAPTIRSLRRFRRRFHFTVESPHA
ncbi:MAG: ECF transporter S component [Chloroflexi bacterium]|nr:MAG: ECF transporter S component [Chloroflexota bacterium]